MLIEPRAVPLGGLRAMDVQRTLPHRQRSHIGAWCFLDQFGPGEEQMLLLPHPHTSLQTVTWPLQGEIRHRDSLGSDVLVRPGELNLMTAGRGISHSEFSQGGTLSGLQMWVAMPSASGAGDPGFEQHRELPKLDGRGFTATVLMGELAGVRSAATIYTPLLGAQLDLHDGAAELELNESFEHGVLAIDDDLQVDGEPVAAGSLLYLPPGRESVRLSAQPGGRALLIGGEPYPEEIVMWWNFIGRSHEEVVQARAEWQTADDRFGVVHGHDGERIPAPPLPNGIRLKPRSNKPAPL